MGELTTLLGVVVICYGESFACSGESLLRVPGKTAWINVLSFDPTVCHDACDHRSVRYMHSLYGVAG